MNNRWHRKAFASVAAASASVALAACSAFAVSLSAPLTAAADTGIGSWVICTGSHLPDTCVDLPNPESEHVACSGSANGTFSGWNEPALESAGSDTTFTMSGTAICTVDGVDDPGGTLLDDASDYGLKFSVPYTLTATEVGPAEIGCAIWAGIGTLNFTINEEPFQESVKVTFVGQAAGGVGVFAMAGIDGSEGDGGVLPAINTLAGGGPYSSVGSPDNDLPLIGTEFSVGPVGSCITEDQSGASVLYHWQGSFTNLDRTPD